MIIDDASKNNKRISLKGCPLLPSMFNLLCLLLPVSLSLYFIVAVLTRKCWGQHSYMSSTFLQPHRMLLAFITKRDGPCFQAEDSPVKKKNNNNYKFLPLRYIFFTRHSIIIMIPYNHYLNYICRDYIFFNSHVCSYRVHFRVFTLSVYRPTL